MKNVLLQPFFKILTTMKEKYGVEEIPYYVCVGIDKDSPISSIGKTLTYTTGSTIEKVNEYYYKLLGALNDGYVVNFLWDGVPRQVILTRQDGGSFPYHARFTSSDNYTWLAMEFDPDKNVFMSYCNVVVGRDREIEQTRRRMSNVKVRRISI